MILLIGSRYGALQDSGLSATHEEYREARGRHPVLVFVHNAVEIEDPQREFLREVQEWERGHFTASFSDGEDLETKVIRALHEHELTTTTGPVNESETLSRALEAVQAEHRGLGQGTSLWVAIAAAPRQQVLRPAELEDANLRRDLMREATYGDYPLLDPAEGTRVILNEATLTIQQTSQWVGLTELGDILVEVSAVTEDPRGHGMLPVLIEEDLFERLQTIMRFCGWLLDRVDPLHRLTDVAIVASIAGGGHVGWRTKQEHEANPNSYSIDPTRQKRAVHLEPPLRRRAALAHDVTRITEDLVVLLRRQYR